MKRVILDPQTSPKIGHNLCTFSKYKYKAVKKLGTEA